jgi:hypothetical protein
MNSFQIKRLSFCFCLFCTLAGPFFFMPLRYVEYDEELNHDLGRLGERVLPESHGYEVNPQGLGAAAGKFFLFGIVIDKYPGQDGWLYLDNREIPGLHTRLAISSPDRPGAGALVIEPLFTDYTRPIALEKFRHARQLRIRYSGKFEGSGKVLILNRVRIRWILVQPAIPYLIVSFLAGVVAYLGCLLRPGASIMICRSCNFIFCSQVIWGLIGWNQWLFAVIAVLGLVLSAWRVHDRKSQMQEENS